MVSRTLALIIVAAVVACSRPDSSSRGDSPSGADSPSSLEQPIVAGDTMAIERAWAVPPTLTNLTCVPGRVRMGDTLTMRMTLPHGSSFMAIAPDGTPYVVVFHGEGHPGRTQRKSLVHPDSFTTMTELRLDTRTQKAGIWVFGRDTNELLFRQPGTYRLKVGTDMETDSPQYAECLVRFVP